MAKSKKVKAEKETVAVSAPAQRSPVNGKALLVCSFALLVLCLLTYAYSMTSEYVFNDNLNYATINGARDKGLFWSMLILSGLNSPLSLPWLRATYAWDISSFGYAPGWSHAVNIVLHALSVIYLFLFTFRVSRYLRDEGKSKLDPMHVAVAAGVLLACHPLVTGSIAYVSGRSGVLGGCNFFLALNCFLFGFLEDDLIFSLLGYVGFAIFTVIGVTTNLECLTLPLVGLALIAVLKPTAETLKKYVTERIFEIALVGMLGVFLAYMLRFDIIAQIDNGFGLPKPSATIYCATQFKAILLYYLRVVLVPFGMTIFPNLIAMRGWSDPATIGGIVTVIALGVAGIIQKQPIVRIGTAIFLLTLLPWLFLVQNELVGDERFYIPLAGLLIAASAGIAYGASKNLFRTGCALAAVAALFIGLGIYRQNEFSTNTKLWRAEILRTPDNPRVHSYLAASLLADPKKVEDAKKEVDTALKLNPDDFTAHLVSGYYFFQKRESDKALTEMKRAVAIGEKLGMTDSELAGFRVQLAKAYFAANDQTSAYNEAVKAHAFITNDSGLNLVIGKEQLKTGKPLMALKTLEDGVKIDPNNAEFLIPIATAALDTGMRSVVQHAYASAKRAVRLRPGPVSDKLYLRACLAFGKIDEGKQRLEASRKIFTNDPEYTWIASGFEEQAGHKEEAESLRKQALAKDPSLAKRMKLTLFDPTAKDVVPAVVMPNQ
ncbi:MAG TPA: hypothetical protein V6C76_09075 [Drouetiella sp.]